MAQNSTAKLLVQLSDEHRMKLILKDGIPRTMEELLGAVRDTCGISGDFRLEYMDKDFGVFVILTNTGDLEDLATIKVLSMPGEVAVVEDATTGLDQQRDSMSTGSTGADGDIMNTPTETDGDIMNTPTETDGDIMNTPSTETDSTSCSTQESVSLRTEQWPDVFDIPVFSHTTEVQLEKGNATYQSGGGRLIYGTKMLSDILQHMGDKIYKYKPYPTKSDYLEAAQALIKKHPCLINRVGNLNGAEGWANKLNTKLQNMRTNLKTLEKGCPEFEINSLKNKCPDDALPAKNVKRPKRGEANHVPPFPPGVTAERLEMERQSLLKEARKKNNERIIREKMAKTFSLRRQEIVDKQPRVEVLQERWPALFNKEEICAEFHRITTVPLEARFMEILDKRASSLLQIIRGKGGTFRTKVNETLQVIDQTVDVNIRRECLLKCLIMYLGEDVGSLIKEYLVVQKDEAEMELAETTMGVFVLRENQGPLCEPVEIGIIIEGVEVLNGQTSVVSACAMLFGLIYTLNLKYPEVLKYSFEALQKIIMNIESKHMSKRVLNLSEKLQEVV